MATLIQFLQTTLTQDLLPLFENRVFIEAWLDAFHANFERFSQFYLK